jgi:hypothetical protein
MTPGVATGGEDNRRIIKRAGKNVKYDHRAD